MNHMSNFNFENCFGIFILLLLLKLHYNFGCCCKLSNVTFEVCNFAIWFITMF